jgi:hypothetical protein
LTRCNSPELARLARTMSKGPDNRQVIFSIGRSPSQARWNGSAARGAGGADVQPWLLEFGHRIPLKCPCLHRQSGSTDPGAENRRRICVNFSTSTCCPFFPRMPRLFARPVPGRRSQPPGTLP